MPSGDTRSEARYCNTRSNIVHRFVCRPILVPRVNRSRHEMRSDTRSETRGTKRGTTMRSPNYRSILAYNSCEARHDNAVAQLSLDSRSRAQTVCRFFLSHLTYQNCNLSYLSIGYRTLFFSTWDGHTLLNKSSMQVGSDKGITEMFMRTVKIYYF